MKRNVGMNLSSNVRLSNILDAAQSDIAAEVHSNIMKRNVGMNLSSNVRLSSVKNVGQKIDSNALQPRKLFVTPSIKSSVLQSMRKNVGARLNRSVPNRQNVSIHHHHLRVTAAAVAAKNSKDQLM